MLSELKSGLTLSPDNDLDLQQIVRRIRNSIANGRFEVEAEERPQKDKPESIKKLFFGMKIKKVKTLKLHCLSNKFVSFSIHFLMR